MIQFQIDERQHSQLRNALVVAADRYTENAKTLREYVQTNFAKPDACIGPAGILKAVARTFDEQRDEALALIEMLDEALERADEAEGYLSE